MQEQQMSPSPPEPFRPAAPPERRLGPYALVREAGRGGMAQVYEAVDTRMGRTVAVKVLASAPHLLPAQRDALIARLKREAQALGSLSHPNVVAIFDVGEQDGLHYLVMEYLDGLTLRQRLDNSGALSPAEAESVLSQVALGLDAVHARGVLHRDIKPSNVMILPNGHVKLMDFGVARHADDTTMTQAGMMVGSPAYLAPELIMGDKGTSASDIWALGVLLYEMLAGRPPFAGDTIPAVLYQIAHGEAAPLSGVSPAVTTVLRRALEKDPAKRFPTAHALADAFRVAALPAASPAAPPPAARRARAYAPVIEEGTAADVAATAIHQTVERSRAGRAPRNPGRNARPAVLALIALLCLGAAGLFAAARLRPANVAARRNARPAARVTPAPAAPRTAAASPPGPARTASAPAASAKKKTPAAPPAPPRRRRPATPSVVVAERPSRPDSRRARTSEEAAVASPQSQSRRTRRPADGRLPVAAAGTGKRPSNPRTQPERARRREARRPTPPRTRVAAAAPDARRADEDGRTEAARENRSGTNNGSPASGNAQTELRGHLAGWIGATNARNIEGQMRYYPNRVDNFYTARRASKGSVQAEKRRVFGAASSVAMSASDPKITVGPDGKTATMRFRKSYDIAGGRRPRKGEVLQELRWRRSDDGKWQIVSERDLRVLRRR